MAYLKTHIKILWHINDELNSSEPLTSILPKFLHKFCKVWSVKWIEWHFR